MKNDPLDRRRGIRPHAGGDVQSPSRWAATCTQAVVRGRRRRLQGALRAGEHEQGAARRSHDRLLGLPGRRQQPADQPADRPEARPAGQVLRDRRHLGRRAAPPSTDFMARNQVPFYGWGFLPGLLRQPLGLRLQRLPGDRTTRARSTRCTRRTWPSGRSRRPGLTPRRSQGRAAGAGQRRRAQPATTTISQLIQARGREGRLQRGQHPGPERRRELHAVRAGDQRRRTRTSC